MAVALVAAGLLVAFVGLATISLPSALIIYAGVVLAILGALFVEVPQP